MRIFKVILLCFIMLSILIPTQSVWPNGTDEFEGFVYKDDAFNTNHPAYANGDFTESGGFGGSKGLHICVGNVDNKNILDGMSGGWTKEFFTEADGSIIQINLTYRLMTAQFDADECAQIMVRIGDGPEEVLEELCGRGLDTGWVTASTTNFVGRGNYTLKVGVYVNKKTGMREKADAYFDDISVEVVSSNAPEDCSNGIDDDWDDFVDCGDSDCWYSEDCICTNYGACRTGLFLSSATFDTNDNGYIYGDDKFGNTNNPKYASGKYAPDSGKSGGGLHIALGDVDAKAILNGISGGWTKSFSCIGDWMVEISFDYRLIMTRFDADECAQVMVQVDEWSEEVHEEVCGRGKDTRWMRGHIGLPLVNGDHTVTISGYVNKKTGKREVADIYIDNVLIRIVGYVSDS